MKKAKASSDLKEFKKDKGKKYIRKYRYFPVFMYDKLDIWLSKMSLSGWHIVDSKAFSFVFEAGTPADKRYFSYSTSEHKKYPFKYVLSDKYPFFDSFYGVKNNKSKINKNETKNIHTVEIDTERIDTECDAGYKEIFDFRRKLSKFNAIYSLTIFLLLISLLSFAWFMLNL